MALVLNDLLNELINDPIGLGYTKFIQTGDDVSVAALLNAPDPSRPTIGREAIRVQEVLFELDNAEFQVLDDLNKLSMSTLLNSPRPLDRNLDKPLLDKATAGMKISGPAVAALWDKTGTRAESLFGDGTLLSDLDVAHALNGQLPSIIVQVPAQIQGPDGKPVPVLDKQGQPVLEDVRVAPTQRVFNTDLGQFVLISATDAVTISTVSKGATQITNATQIGTPVVLKPVLEPTPVVGVTLNTTPLGGKA